LKAIEVVEKLGGTAKIPNRNEILDNLPNNIDQ
jgi:hypothetical protein